MNDFFNELAEALTAAALERGSTIEQPRLDQPLAEELLELARVVAHTRERRFAPLACYLAGVAAGRMRDDAQVLEVLKTVRRRYEP